jgi:hypothetical protein
MCRRPISPGSPPNAEKCSIAKYRLANTAETLVASTPCRYSEKPEPDNGRPDCKIKNDLNRAPAQVSTELIQGGTEWLEFHVVSS